MVPTAPWLIARMRSGTLNWICNRNQPEHALEGFASQVSAVPGDDVAVFVNTTARAVQVQAYRMGYYQGLGGRLIVQSDIVPARSRAAPIVTPGIGTVTCPWSPRSPSTSPRLAARVLPLQAGRRRGRRAVRPPHRPRRHIQGGLRAAEQRHHLAGLQPVGRLQPLLRATATGGRTSPGGPGPSRSTAPTRRPGPRARRTSWATSFRSSSTWRASASTSPTGPTSTSTPTRNGWRGTAASSAWATTSTGPVHARGARRPAGA